MRSLLSPWFVLQVMRAQLDLAQVRQEIDRRIQEKEEEFENTRWESDRWKIHV